MSRRDEVVESIDNVFTTLRTHLSAALDSSYAQQPAGSYNAATDRLPNVNGVGPYSRHPSSSQQHSRGDGRRSSVSNGPGSRVGQRLVSVISSVLDLPPPSSSSNNKPTAYVPESSSPLSSSPGGGFNQQTPSRLPFSQGAYHETMDSLPPQASLPYSTSSSGSHFNEDSRFLPSSSPSSGLGGPSAPDDSGALPAYSRRAPTDIVREIPKKKIHVYTSKSKKLKLEIKAAGDHHMVLMQSDPDEMLDLEGILKISLPQPESITHIKIRLKGIVRTMVMKVQGSGRHPVVDEVVLWEDAADLFNPSHYTSSDQTLPPTIQADSTDPTKIQGTMEFPFKLNLPSKVIRSLQNQNIPETARRVRLPPSFVLAGEGGPTPSSSTEWASCRYFLKVTLGRKGLLKVNERWIVPLIFIPRHPDPVLSPARLLALAGGLPPPGPLEDPSGWTGKKVRHQVKRGVFSGSSTNRKGWYEVVLLLPKPSYFSRLSSIPFAIKITSSDPNATTRFPLKSLKVFLVQRCFVSAQGLADRHDSVVAKGTISVDGPEFGVAIPPEEGSGGAVWGKRYQGNIKLGHTVGSSFRVPNIALQFLIGVHVFAPGAGNDCELACPVEIVSAAETSFPGTRSRSSSHTNLLNLANGNGGLGVGNGRVPRPSTPISSSSPIIATSLPSSSTAEAQLALPPSYFDVMEGKD